MFSIHDAKVQHSASPNSRNVMNRHELASYCELFLERLSIINPNPIRRLIICVNLWINSNVAHPAAPRLRFFLV